MSKHFLKGLSQFLRIRIPEMSQIVEEKNHFSSFHETEEDPY